MGAGVATPERFGTEQIGGCQLEEDERHGATEDAKALPRDEELAVEGATLQEAKDWTGCMESKATNSTLHLAK